MYNTVLNEISWETMLAATGVNYKRVIILSYLISIFSCLHLKSNNPVFQFSSNLFRSVYFHSKII